MQFRFRISSLLLLTLFIALVFWCFTLESIADHPSQFLSRFFLSTIAIGVVFALQARQTRPLLSAATAGALFVASLTCVGVADEIIGYFFYTGARPYYEYGFFVHTFVVHSFFACSTARWLRWYQFCRVGSQSNVWVRVRPTKVDDFWFPSGDDGRFPSKISPRFGGAERTQYEVF